MLSYVGNAGGNGSAVMYEMGKAQNKAVYSKELTTGHLYNCETQSVRYFRYDNKLIRLLSSRPSIFMTSVTSGNRNVQIFTLYVCVHIHEGLSL